MLPLITAETDPDYTPTIAAGVSPAEVPIVRWWPDGRPRFHPRPILVDSNWWPVHPFVCDGRWTVECPDCGAWQAAAWTDRRMFCLGCLNLELDGRWRRVVWRRQSQQVTALLQARGKREDQQWRGWEAIRWLRFQNTLLESAPAGVSQSCGWVGIP